MLRSYYSRHMPVEQLFSWIGTDTDTSKLEWAFVLENDIFVRYLAFKNATDMKAKLVEKLPVSIHMGATYNYPPSMHSQQPEGTVQAISRHLVLDIDATDYSDVRFCCKMLCDKCWLLIVGAMKLCDFILRKAFGFKHILWCYSGRRGVHCWVSDARAKTLDWEGRRAVAEYIGTPITGWNIWMTEDWFSVVDHVFQEYINVQRLYMGCDGYNDLITGFVDQVDRHRMPVASDCKIQDTESAWPYFKQIHIDRASNGKGSVQWQSVLYRVVFKYMQPRLDMNVTKHMNHLLKIPFSIHPSTNKICCPIDISKVDDFHIDDVPTVENLKSTDMEGYIEILSRSAPPPPPPPASADLSW